MLIYSKHILFVCSIMIRVSNPPFHPRCSFLFLGTYFYFCMGAHIGMEGHLGDRLRRGCRLMHRFVFFLSGFF